jgi:hypothetical protein
MGIRDFLRKNFVDEAFEHPTAPTGRRVIPEN